MGDRSSGGRSWAETVSDRELMAAKTVASRRAGDFMIGRERRGSVGEMVRADQSPSIMSQNSSAFASVGDCFRGAGEGLGLGPGLGFLSVRGFVLGSGVRDGRRRVSGCEDGPQAGQRPPRPSGLPQVLQSSTGCSLKAAGLPE